MPTRTIPDGTVLAAVLRSTCAGLRRLSIDADAALRSAKLDPSDLDRPDARLPALEVREFWNEVVRISGDPDIGLHLAETIDAGELDALDFAMRAAPTAGEALRRFCRYHRVVNSGAEFTLDVGADRAVLRHGVPAFVPMPRALREFVLAALVVAGRQATGRAWEPREVRFAHGKPANITEHRRLLGTNVHFGCPFDELVVGSEVLDLPQLRADARLAEVLGRYLDESLARLPAGTTFVARVRHAIAAALAGEGPSVARTARLLGMSSRTLARRLEDEGASHSKLVDEHRTAMATGLLREGRLSVGEIGYLLGFSDPSAFCRAFVRWTGVTPTALRQQCPDTRT